MQNYELEKPSKILNFAFIISPASWRLCVNFLAKARRREGITNSELGMVN